MTGSTDPTNTNRHSRERQRPAAGEPILERRSTIADSALLLLTTGRSSDLPAERLIIPSDRATVYATPIDNGYRPPDPTAGRCGEHRSEDS